MLSRLSAGLLAVMALASVSAVALCCPFCTAIAPTFSEEITSSAAAVVVKLSKPAPPQKLTSAGTPDVTEPSKATFEVIEVLKGKEHLEGVKKLEAIYFGEAPVGSKFLLMGLDPPNISWSTPIAVNDRIITYVKEGLDLPKQGPDRLAYFQEYFEDNDEMLARDAYDEFAKVPYADVKALKDRMHREKLIGWIKDPQVQASRRRLYLTLLSICGTKDDAEMLSEMMKSKDERAKRALDAMVSAYLVLKGPDGLPLIEDLFLKNKDAEYTETYATVQAIRFQGQEEKVIPRERLAEALRYMLERPQLADIVIPDLARWQDWTVMDKLVELFKNADENTSFVRVPVVNYLRACPKKEAKEHLTELEKIDPDAVKRANTFFPFGAGAPAKPADSASPKPDAPPTKVEAGKPAAPPPDDKKTADARKFNPETGVAIGPAGLPQLAQAARVERLEVGRGVVVAGLAAFSLALWGAFTLILRTGRTTRAN